MLKILFIGDIVGKPGRTAVLKILPALRREEKIDLVVANAENAAGGSGITQPIADELFSAGVDVLTSGDHIWKKPEIYPYLEETDKVLRPANYPAGAPGKGAVLVKTGDKGDVGVINLLGRVFMDAVDCPFVSAKCEVEKLKKKTNVIVVDFHAEATSEKVAMGYFLDGVVSAVIGTHTHVQTADERILPNGTAYLTDTGMTGPFDSVIGRKKENIIERFVTQRPTRFEVASGDEQMHGVMVEIDQDSGKAVRIERVQKKA
ncbi:MAG: TIGR00282 family metallophosphoesterase [Candidatus Omnitrophica bacterium]|nr:TIGR00282 family metallophosphoesterase [Candidatus Omnitrophota bacterium]